MTLQQLRFLREVVRQSFNTTAAATVLNTSQPGVSRQIIMLEQELGMSLLIRHKSRIVGLTEAGKTVFQATLRLLNEVENICLIAEETRGGAGTLTLAASHLHARYTLVEPFKEFRASHDNISMLIHQAPTDEITELVKSGEADIAITTSDDVQHSHPTLTFLRGAALSRSLITPVNHPLAKENHLSLNDISQYPIVGYSPRSTSGKAITYAFKNQGLELKFVVRASDSDIIKSYVSEGIGIGIVPTPALGTSLSKNLYAIDITELLPQAWTCIIIRRDMFLPKYLFDFIKLIAPKWEKTAILKAIGKANTPLSHLLPCNT